MHRLFAVVVLAAGLTASVKAQQNPRIAGTYVFSEEGGTAGPNVGQNIAALASLTLGETGIVTGREVIQSQGGITFLDVQGAWSLGEDRSGTLLLNATAMGGDGDPVTTAQSYKFVVGATGNLSLLRSNLGFYATARMTPAASTPAMGSWVFGEHLSDRSFARISVVTFGAAGSVTASEIAESLGQEKRLSHDGSTQTEPHGFQALTLTTTATDENGDTQNKRESYLFLVGRDEIRMIRACATGHILDTLAWILA